MSKFGVSQPVTRIEDARFLRGLGRYVDDIRAQREVHCLFVRAPVAHADLRLVDVEAARAAPGVHLVLTGADLDAAMDNDVDSFQIENRDGTQSVRPRRPILASGRVRHVGEAVVMIVADTIEAAKDAADLVEIDYRALPTTVATDAAMAPGAAQVHEGAPGNLCYDWAVGDEAKTAEAMAGAAHRVELTLINNRVIASPMEPRGAIADWDGARLTVEFNGQGVWDLKGELARRFGLDESAVRTKTPDVGGGFGIKGLNYPEHFAVAHAARTLGRPVKWMSERGEAMQSDAMGRDHVTHMVAGFDADLRLVAMQVDCVSNLGAYVSPFGAFIASDLAARVLTGVYDLQAAWFRVRGVFTHTTPVDAYRGAGRPEAQYALERLIDKSARVLGVDPVELRRRNFIKPAQFPYHTVVGETYDVGNFDRVLTRALVEADHAGFGGRRAEARARGAHRGLGLCYYIESILGDQSETAEIAFMPDGGIDLMVGTQSNGQGHETVYTQILHQRTGLPFERIRVVQGDSDRIPNGGGTGGSRSVTMQSAAINGASDDLIAKMRPLAEELLEVAAADLVWDDGAWRVAGTDRAVDLAALAEHARATGRPDFLSQQTRTTVPGRSYPNGCHIAEVEVDGETGGTRVVKYTVVDDFGLLMNPLLAEGQVHGGVVQGIGQAISEHVVYDSDGQLLSASYMDYGVPRAADVPMLPFHHEGTPSLHNAVGMKGCGEAGTVGALAAVTNAVVDALWDLGITQVDMPMTPARVWSWLRTAPRAAE